jgi:uncharacterized coiled-coil DUF342 family protein
MKRSISLIVTALFVASFIQAQTNETLTNNAIVKMVKANLSNELIIDVIQSSPVLFTLNETAIKNLESENVPSPVIDAMKIAGQKKPSMAKNNVPVKEPVAEKMVAGGDPMVTSDKPATVLVTVQQMEGVQDTEVLDALNYVTPVKELVMFYEKEFKELDGTLREWDNKIRSTLKEVDEINLQILQLESDLREKKNADSKGYSDDILSMKKKLAEYRLNYKQLKTKLLADGENITSKLTDLSSEKARSIGKKYDEVNQLVKSSNTDPGTGERIVPITFTSLTIVNSTTNFIAPATEMLVWHCNEINIIQDLVREWNPKVREIIQKDAELNAKLQPINSKLEEYKSNSKKYKSEISSLKKQREGIEKERKQLASQMENDSNNLADNLKTACLKIQESVKQRFSDIIGNINYSYQEKLNL